MLSQADLDTIATGNLADRPRKAYFGELNLQCKICKIVVENQEDRISAYIRKHSIK